MITRKVGMLLKKPVGSREEFQIDAIIENYHIKADFEILKLPNELNVQMNNLSTSIVCPCSRCLKNFTLPIAVPFAEREFLVDLEERDMEEGEEVFYVHLGKSEIVLDDMIREEVLLHFPEFPLCSESCKGLCDRCGKDLNRGPPCVCPHADALRINPFRIIP